MLSNSVETWVTEKIAQEGWNSRWRARIRQPRNGRPNVSKRPSKLAFRRANIAEAFDDLAEFIGGELEEARERDEDEHDDEDEEEAEDKWPCFHPRRLTAHEPLLVANSMPRPIPSGTAA